MTQAPFPAQSILFLSHDQRSDITAYLSARAIAIENNPDLFMIESEKALGIDDVRTLQTWSMDKPYAHDWKVAVLLAAETLTLPAQNAMLKLLEEPPEHTYLVLMSTSDYVLLPTILSRCVVIHSTNQSKDQEQIHLPKTHAEITAVVDEYGKDRSTAVAYCESLMLQLKKAVEIHPSEML
ncbi:MAG TPA: hypothetical protein VFG51_01940, partial [Candidatus Saccharimonadia bacterium]|nr:hypothetical protein [Candidatus Saccharimonadia bacterium]